MARHLVVVRRPGVAFQSYVFDWRTQTAGPVSEVPGEMIVSGSAMIKTVGEERTSPEPGFQKK